MNTQTPKHSLHTSNHAASHPASHAASHAASETGTANAPLHGYDKPVAVSGDRPTGPLHLGHYAGSLQTRLALQETHRQFVLIADLQALTDNAERPQEVATNVLSVALDYLAIGIDPKRSTICVQSHIPELAELTMYLLNLVSIARLERNPTVKSEIRQRRFKGGIPAGFLIYPVSQAADITAFRASAVAVGEDQLPMIEQTNELVRSVNRICGRALLPQVQAVLGRTGRLPGTDAGAAGNANKMSKSAGNTIALNASSDDIRSAVARLYTDAHHLRAQDPGRVQGNLVFTYLDAFATDQAYVDALKLRYVSGGLGDVALKAELIDVLENLIAPIRERRARFSNDPAEVTRLLRQGTEQARGSAAMTVSELRHALGFGYFN